jgi:FAD synthetase
MQALIQKAQNIIRTALEKYSLEQVAIIFNGGKDSVVLLELVRTVLRADLSQRDNKKRFPIKVIYFRSDDTFPEIDEFINQMVNRYSLELITITSQSIKSGLTRLKKTYPDIQALMIGTRSTDPHGGALSSFSPTSSGWPEYMRINPLLEWSYEAIWKYILTFSMPYCSLYDQGYTSIGDRSSTFPNPALKRDMNSEIVEYEPAWLLEDGSRERDDRI